MAYEYKLQPVRYVDQKGYYQTRMESVLTYNPNSVLAGTPAAGEAVVQEQQSQSGQSKPCCWILIVFISTFFALVVSGIIIAVVMLL
jgi:hypothetical protein